MGHFPLTPPITALADRLLVIAAAVLALGLGAALASLEPFPSEHGGTVWPRPMMAVHCGVASRQVWSRDRSAPPTGSNRTPGTPPATHTVSQLDSFFHLPSDAAMIETGMAHGGGSWYSGRQDSPSDPRSYLIETAITIHAPASAPAPRRRSASSHPYPHGVD